jgi:hydroxyacylglutathione hydrolase
LGSKALEGIMASMQIAVVPVTGFRQNASLVWCNNQKIGAVVDPGGDVADLMSAVAQVEREHGVRFNQIWLTHGHIDHAGGAAELAEKLTARQSAATPIIGPDARDLFLLQRLPQSGAQFGMPTARAVTPDRWLVEGDTVELGDLRFAVLHCPGHTPGSVVLFNERDRFALVGDVLFQGSVGRTDFDYGDHAALISAIKTKLLPLGDDVSFLPGHGEPSTIGDERRSNPFIQ